MCIYTLQETNLSPKNGILSRWFSFSRLVGYVNPLEGIYIYLCMNSICTRTYTVELASSGVSICHVFCWAPTTRKSGQNLLKQLICWDKSMKSPWFAAFPSQIIGFVQGNFFTFYHGNSPLNHHWENMFYFFKHHLKQIPELVFHPDFWPGPHMKKVLSKHSAWCWLLEIPPNRWFSKGTQPKCPKHSGLRHTLPEANSKH